MKMLQLLPYRFWGGPEIQSFQMAEQLQKVNGITTEFLLYTSPHCSDSDLELVTKKAREYGLKITLRSSPSILHLLGERKSLAQLCKKHRIDMLISSGYLCNILTAYQKIHKISIVHGWTTQNLKIRIYEYIDRFLLKSFDAVGCVSRQQQVQLKKMGILTHLLSNSFDLRVSVQNPVTKKTLLKELNLDSDSMILLSVGRLSREKGQKFALDAFKKVSYERNNLHWVFIGDGPEKENLIWKAQQLGLKQHVHFIGQRDLAIRYMSAADLFVLPSHREGLPVVLLEAISQHLPLVVTNVGGNPEVVVHKKTGLLVQDNNRNDLADQITWASQNLDQMKQFSDNALNHLQNNFSLEKQRDQWQEIIRHALSK